MHRDSQLDPRLAPILARLVEFRKSRASGGAHIPVLLRKLVLNAAASGVSLSAISRHLGISNSQMEKWRRENGAAASLSPRILEVIGSQAEHAPAPAGLRVTYESGRLVLELFL
jgi:hypothetical protein